MVALISAFVFSVHGQSASDLKALINELMVTRGYDKRIRPTNILNEPVRATIDFSLTGINAFDLVSQKLTTTGYLYVWWTDEFLSWESSSFNGIEQVLLPQDDVWKPDIALQNSYEKLSEHGDKFLNVRVDSSGEILWYPYEIFKTTCSVTVKYFPFDAQTCHLKFIPWSSNQEEVNLTKGSKDVDLERYEENGEWDLLAANIESKHLDGEGAVIISLFMKRKPLFYVLNILFPVLLLSFLNVFVFLLPADSGEKISFSITVFLAFAVFLTIVSTSIPKNSNIDDTTIFGIYLLLLEIKSTLVLVSTVLLLRLFHRDPQIPVGPWLQKIVIVTRRLRCKSPKKVIPHVGKTHVNVEKKYSTQNLQDIGIHWHDVTHALDYLFFWLFMITLLTITVVVMIILTSSQES